MSLQCRDQLTLYRVKAVKFVLSPAVSGLYVPTVTALRGLTTSRPHPSTLIPLHIWSPSKSSVLSLSYARGRAAGSSEKGEEEKKVENSFPSVLQTFRNGSRGRGQRLGLDGRMSSKPSALACDCQEWISTVFTLALVPFCSASQIVLPLGSRTGWLSLIWPTASAVYSLSQEAVPVV